MEDKEVRTSRPRLVAITVYLLFAAGLFQIIYSFTGATATYGRFYPAAQVLLVILAFVALTGILSMEKWGVWLFLAALAARVLVDFQVGAVHPASLLLLVPAAIFIRQLLMPKRD
jgi:hypothetical protein